MEKTGTVLPCPKCGSGFLAWGKPFRSATPKLVVLLGQHRRIVCCVMCGYYAPLKKWNKEERKMNLIREIFFSPMVVDAAGIILIVAALPMAGWSLAVSHMAGPKVKNAKEGT